MKTRKRKAKAPNVKYELIWCPSDDSLKKVPKKVAMEWGVWLPRINRESAELCMHANRENPSFIFAKIRRLPLAPKRGRKP